VFANSQWYAGPIVGSQVTLPIWGPVSWVTSLHLEPVWSFLQDDIRLAEGVNAADAGQLEQLPFMLGAYGEFGLEVGWQRWVSRLSYKFETLRPFGGEFQDFNSAGLSIGYRY